jgi:hypothetical protein
MLCGAVMTAPVRLDRVSPYQKAMKQWQGDALRSRDDRPVKTGPGSARQSFALPKTMKQCWGAAPGSREPRAATASPGKI